MDSYLLENRIEKKVSLLQLFYSFLRLGITSFGGPVMVVYIQRMVVNQKKWLDEDTFRNGVAICQTIPGATSTQNAAYVGLRLRGIQGAAICFTAFLLPAFIFMMALSALYVNFHSVPIVTSLFNGLKAIVIAIMASATLSYGIETLYHWPRLIITFISALMFAIGINPIIVIITAAIQGIIIYFRYQIPSSSYVTNKISYSLKPIIYIIIVLIFMLIILALFNPELFNLAVLMLRIDLFAFGGGYAAVPLMFHEVVDIRHWLTSSTLLDGIILGQITPGPIVITATFIGYLLHGPIGGIVATLCIFLPSFVIIVCVVPYFDKFQKSTLFSKAITGILCSFVGLLLMVTLRFAYNIEWDMKYAIIASGAFIALVLKIDILWVVLAGAIISILIFYIV